MPAALFGGVEIASAACASGLADDLFSSSLAKREERVASASRIESQVALSRASSARLLAGSLRRNCSIAASRLAGSESCTALVYAVKAAVLDGCDHRLEVTATQRVKNVATIALARVLTNTLVWGIYSV
jgi:hypothetical protein